MLPAARSKTARRVSIYDDFNDTALGDWTAVGTNYVMNGSTFAATTTNNRYAGILSTRGLAGDDGYVEATLATPPVAATAGASSSRLVCRVNSAGTSGALVSLFTNGVWMATFSGALNTALTFTDFASRTTGLLIGAGDTIRLAFSGTTYTLSQNGVVILTGVTANAPSGVGNRRVGLQVDRRTTAPAAFDSVSAFG